ncbi:Uncharacterised protein [Vibrio cholerae]|nr:Uncharacterised protein [Vibrio cholerae]
MIFGWRRWGFRRFFFLTLQATRDANALNSLSKLIGFSPN